MIQDKINYECKTHPEVRPILSTKRGRRLERAEMVVMTANRDHYLLFVKLCLPNSVMKTLEMELGRVRLDGYSLVI